MHKLRIGQPFPLPLVLRDGLAVTPEPDGGYMALIHLSFFQKGDLRAFRSDMQVGVTMIEDNVPWVSLYFPRNKLYLDAPLLVGHREDLRLLAAREGNLLQVVVLEGPDYIIRHLRSVGLDPTLTALLKRAATQHMDEIQAQWLIRATQARYPSSKHLFDRATARQHFTRTTGLER